MIVSRRGIASVAAAAFAGICAPWRLCAAAISVLPRPKSGPQIVQIGTERADVTWLPTGEQTALVRAQRFNIDGPPVDMLYEVIADEPIEDLTRLKLPNGRWAKQIYPSNVLDARAFGAFGDGKRDDTQALQDLFDTTVRLGAKAYIPAGTYRITRPLIVGSDDKSEKFRGFTIEGSGRTGINGESSIGGTLILLDSPQPERAVIIWKSNAWRDTRFCGLGLASRHTDGAQYGLLVESSEVSHLSFEHLGVENVTTAFALLAGTGANGEFCGWYHIQTRNVLNFFESDAGQAYGLRFRDSFCYYRAGGTLFKFATEIVGGGLHLDNFDASPVIIQDQGVKMTCSGTKLFSISGNHKGPITVVGGRFEHITTIAEVTASAMNVIVHNHIQFVGTDFTTDLDSKAIVAGYASIIARKTALLDVNFLNCSFASAWPQVSDERVLVTADDGCRGNVRFVQCGFVGYGAEPGYAGHADGQFQVGWQDCTANDVTERGRAYGKRYESHANKGIDVPDMKTES